MSGIFVMLCSFFDVAVAVAVFHFFFLFINFPFIISTYSVVLCALEVLLIFVIDLISLNPF